MGKGVTVPRITEFHWSGACPVGPGHSVWERIPDSTTKSYFTFDPSTIYKVLLSS